jgi:nicotinate-nucleotide adenylyltransferase
MVSPEYPWKRGADDLAPEDVRYDTVRAALRGEKGLVASDYEFHLPKPSYTWNTLPHLERDYPQHQFVLIVGGDNWERFPQWAHAEEIVQHYEIAVSPRSGAEQSVPSIQCGNITIVHVPLINITSTQIRQMLRNGEDVSQLVPSAIRDMLTPWM